MNIKSLAHPILFLVFSLLVITVELYSSTQKLLLLSALPLIFIAIHLSFFTKDFLKELLFITVSFSLIFFSGFLISNIDIHHFGFVELPGHNWPPPWIASLWLMLPLLFCTSLKFLYNARIAGAYAGAFLVYAAYHFIFEPFDLLFFHKPPMQSALLFVLSWYLILRIIFWLHKRITL